MDASASARTTSAVIITRRLRIRSTQAPTGSPITRNASVSAALSRPTSCAVASRTSTASTGMANVPTCSPAWLSVSPNQSRTNDGLRHTERDATPASAVSRGSVVSRIRSL